MLGVKRSREDMYISTLTMTPNQIMFYKNFRKDIESLRGCKNLDYVACLAKDFNLMCCNYYPEDAEYYLCELITELWDEADAPIDTSPFEWEFNMEKIDDNYNKYSVGRNILLDHHP